MLSSRSLPGSLLLVHIDNPLPRQAPRQQYRQVHNPKERPEQDHVWLFRLAKYHNKTGCQKAANH